MYFINKSNSFVLLVFSDIVSDFMKLNVRLGDIEQERMDRLSGEGLSG